VIVPVPLKSTGSASAELNSSDEEVAGTKGVKGFGKKEDKEELMTAPYIAKPVQVMICSMDSYVCIYVCMYICMYV
jgi:hypothetical protein